MSGFAKSSINNADNFVDIILTMHTQCNATEKSVLKMVTRKGTSAEYHKYYFYKKMFLYHICCTFSCRQYFRNSDALSKTLSLYDVVFFSRKYERLLARVCSNKSTGSVNGIWYAFESFNMLLQDNTTCVTYFQKRKISFP